jgi:hypothetical protein
MAPTLDSILVSLAIQATANNVLDLQSATSPLSWSKPLSMTTGTGAGQADRVFTDTRTIAASGNDDLDLAGVLTDPLGAVLTFARIKTMAIYAYGANTNNLTIGNAAANGFISWVGGATHTVTVRPGGLLLLAGTDATAYAVTAATADILRVTNAAGGSSVTYDIVLIGSSA